MKIEAVDRAGMNMTGGTGVTFLRNTINILLTVVRYAFLLVMLFLLASHENANPKLGTTSIEFYTAEFRSAYISDINKNLPDEINKNTEWSLVHKFYYDRQYMPAWTTNFEVKTTFIELVELIKNAYHYGLIPSFYHYDELINLERQLTEPMGDDQKMNIRVQLEKNASWAALHLMNHLAVGINQADTSTSYIEFFNSLPWYLSLQLENNTLGEGILGMQPKNKQYIKLQRAASRYISKASADTAKYSVEELAGNFNLVKERLIRQGYLDESFVNDTNAIQSAIRNYQRAHCLEITGITDNSTLEALTSDVRKEFYKIALNLDRLRKDELNNENSILVNIPEFKLYYYDSKGSGKTFNVIVGKENTPTPIVTSQIEWIIANPYWTVPQSITKNEILPIIKKDSTYLERNGFKVVDKDCKPIDASNFDWNTMNPEEFTYWFRQDNDNNALGVIKFVFPNPHSVYLHDTQSKKLFEKRIRTFSHGCIRVQNPEELAQLVVSEYSKSSGRIDIKKVIDRKKHREIRIDRTLPIYIRYYSCTADSLGNIFFHPDVYSMDEQAINELFGKSGWN